MFDVDIELTPGTFNSLVLFSLTESDEPGKIHYQGIVYVFLIGFAASFVTCWFCGKKKCKKKEPAGVEA